MKGLDYTFYYFDRASYLMGIGVIMKAYVAEGKITNFEELPMEEVFGTMADLDPALDSRLHQYPLQPNQFIMPQYRHADSTELNRDESIANAMCLNTIVDTIGNEDWSVESRKAYEKFVSIVKPPIFCRKVVIRYINRYDGDQAKEYHYNLY